MSNLAMYATFDRHSPVKFDSKIHCLSWKGNARYGWLALGNSANTVGVTYTELNEDVPDSQSNNGDPEVSLEKQGMRRNFNFREHTKEVSRKELSVFFMRFMIIPSTGDHCQVESIAR